MATESESGSEARRGETPYVRILVVYACVLVLGMGLAWANLSMRAVGDDASWLIAIAIPAMLIAMFVGSGVGMSIGAPALLLPMWALLFTSLGWNFLELGLTDGTDVGFLVCGVLFWVMAAPAWVALFLSLRKSVFQSLDLPVQEKARRKTREEKLAEKRADTGPWSAASLGGSPWWWLIYVALGCGGALFGVAVYAAAS